jgi:hypothetical protein
MSSSRNCARVAPPERTLVPPARRPALTAFSCRRISAAISSSNVKVSMSPSTSTPTSLVRHSVTHGAVTGSIVSSGSPNLSHAAKSKSRIRCWRFVGLPALVSAPLLRISPSPSQRFSVKVAAPS